MKTIKVKLTFAEPVLGTCPGDPEIYRNFIGAKAPDAGTVDDEVEALGTDAVVDRLKTIFPRDNDGRPFLYDYQIKGFFKAACQALRKVPGKASAGVKAFKKEIDTLIFPAPRKIPLEFEGEMGECQRSLRASTPQGEKICLAISDMIPAGATCRFQVTCLADDRAKLVREWLDYGVWSGIGQWRNSGMGRFTWEELPGEEEPEFDVVELDEEAKPTRKMRK